MTGQRSRTCGSCGDLILWAVTGAGKRMPVDVEPSPEGNLALNSALTPTVRVVPPHLRYPGQKLYTSHFATCRGADRHRKTRSLAPKAKPLAEQDALFGAGR